MGATEIVPGLWMGGESLFPTPPSGFDAYLSLREVPDVYFPPLLPMVVQSGPVFMQVPMIDEALLPPLFKIGVACVFVCSVLQDKKRVLCHCKQGHNRSGLIVATYLVTYAHFKAQDVVDLIRGKRPGALTNQTFVDFIMGLT